MTRPFRYPALLLAVSTMLAFPGCAAVSPAPPSSSTVIAPLVPASTRAAVVALIAKHPEAKPFLVTVANGLQSIAKADARLPDPDGTFGTLLSWASLIPEAGGYINDFMVIYRQAYPSLVKSGAVMSEIAEIVRAGAA